MLPKGMPKSGSMYTRRRGWPDDVGIITVGQSELFAGRLCHGDKPIPIGQQNLMLGTEAQIGFLFVNDLKKLRDVIIFRCFLDDLDLLGWLLGSVPRWVSSFSGRNMFLPSRAPSVSARSSSFNERGMPQAHMDIRGWMG